MKKMEMRKVCVTYCDWCGEEITESSHTFVENEGEPIKDFHSWSKKCIDEYEAEALAKYKAERKRKKENL
jgi:hypothetical protein